MQLFIACLQPSASNHVKLRISISRRLRNIRGITKFMLNPSLSLNKTKLPLTGDQCWGMRPRYIRSHKIIKILTISYTNGHELQLNYPPPTIRTLPFEMDLELLTNFTTSRTSFNLRMVTILSRLIIPAIIAPTTETVTLIFVVLATTILLLLFKTSLRIVPKS